MFKKKKTTKQKRKNFRSSSSSNAAAPANKDRQDKVKDLQEEEEEESHLQNILTLKKRRTILNSVDNSRGLNAITLLSSTAEKSNNNNNNNVSEQTSNNVDSSSSEKKSSAKFRNFGNALKDLNNGDDDFEEEFGGGIMGQKHREAMETFIQQQITTMNNKNSSNNTANNGDNDTNSKDKIEGDIIIGTATTKAGSSNQDADVGAGGAMLGGTGIAEVILPVEERLKNIQRTQTQIQEEFMLSNHQNHNTYSSIYKKETHGINDKNNSKITSNNNHGIHNMVPTSFGQGPAKAKKWNKQQSKNTVTTKTSISNLLPPTSTSISAGVLLNKSDVEGIATSYSHNFKLHSHEWISQKKDREQQQNQADKQSSAKNNVNEDEYHHSQANQERIGFEAAYSSTDKGKSKNNNNGNNTHSKSQHHSQQQQKRSNDDRVYSNFLKMQLAHGRK